MTAQQRAVLRALAESRVPMPTSILRDVRVREGDMYPQSLTPDFTYAIGEPVAAVLRRLAKHGLVTGEKRRENEWTITNEGREALS